MVISISDGDFLRGLSSKERNGYEESLPSTANDSRFQGEGCWDALSNSSRQETSHPYRLSLYKTHAMNGSPCDLEVSSFELNDHNSMVNETHELKAHWPNDQ